ncbi:SAM-dependent methyltransferase [Rhodothalassium salexigens]|uniref:SAM-dependent methyltransferase n=1 Tax=Rhodothalassium salexigens TaxID=1086 RepID=UPI001912C6F6|nr:cyclopropane-fatty-acyl-phospholipid synthase family protein [Rhodothalassium salexigens]MBK5911062.1 SAM-dependent methyltransferase [Rhodothalassium salexigens]MBK5919492.1 SAM-dependent methyltransferase [Rhodothalassium salexigens]
MWAQLLTNSLRHFIKTGALMVIFPDGQSARFGAGDARPVAIRLRTQAMVQRLVLDPDLALGEGYMDGDLTIESGDLYGLLSCLLGNMPDRGSWRSPWARRWLRRGRAPSNPVHRARRNAAHHYDLSGTLYDLFLDPDRQYSCAYFRHPQDNLATAQANKKALIAAKLLLEPGHRVLDIGCGWGGLGLELARQHDARVTGLTLSNEQYKRARAQAEALGLAERVAFRLQDYRHATGTYDRIVSVGMFEHVGAAHYETFFHTVRDRLADDGVALIHTIGRADGPGRTHPWIAKYIFPGGYSPALSEILPAIERAGLCVTDVEVLRLHYAETLRAWRARFEANLDRIRALYDDRFCRMWRFYLVGSELAFRLGGHVVFQIQMAKRQTAVPLTRDYLLTTAPPAVTARPAHRHADHHAA